MAVKNIELETLTIKSVSDIFGVSELEAGAVALKALADAIYKNVNDADILEKISQDSAQLVEAMFDSKSEGKQIEDGKAEGKQEYVALAEGGFVSVDGKSIVKDINEAYIFNATEKEIEITKAFISGIFPGSENDLSLELKSKFVNAPKQEIKKAEEVFGDIIKDIIGKNPELKSFQEKLSKKIDEAKAPVGPTYIAFMVDERSGEFRYFCGFSKNEVPGTVAANFSSDYDHATKISSADINRIMGILTSKDGAGKVFKRQVQ